MPAGRSAAVFVGPSVMTTLAGGLKCQSLCLHNALELLPIPRTYSH